MDIEPIAAFLAGVVLVSSFWIGSFLQRWLDVSKQKWQTQIYHIDSRFKAGHKKRE
tara:strand:- start:22 stop:189 length:168 start_codon:yes stop_codon:yes gene_type:complete